MVRTAIIWGALATMVLAAPAVAQNNGAADPTGGTGMATEGAFDASGALGEADLGRIAGREDRGAMIASATQRNTVANNSVNGNSVTGDIAIDGNAFQNLQGMAVISANSGNNVAINSAMNVTINMGAPQ